MIVHLKHKQINKKRWDEALARCTNKLPYAQSWYLDRVCPGWEALILDNYETIMPIPIRKKYGITYSFPPYFAQQLGVFSNSKITMNLIQTFLDSIPENYKFIELNLNTQNTFKLSGYRQKKNTNIELSLEKSYEALKKGFSEDIKRNIKKAEKKEVTLLRNISPEEIIRIFRDNTGKKINNLKSSDYTVLKKLIYDCLNKKQAKVWGASVEGKLCAGVIWLTSPNRSVFLFSATDTLARKNGAMHFLIDRFISENAGKKMILDFEGSNLPGLARFYKGFGSDEYVYLQIQKNRLPKLVRWLKR